MIRPAPCWLAVAALLLALICAPASGQAAGGATAVAPVRYVVIMSFDGARADAVRQAMPAALVARAAYSWTAQTTLPSSTLPAHTSMLTGLSPDVHKVLFNSWIPARGYIALPTVFSVVTSGGGVAAAFVAKSKMLFLAGPGTVAAAEYVAFPANDEVEVARQAARYLAQVRPHLLFIHMADPDAAGHASGWMSAPYLAATRKIPDAVSVVLDTLSRMFALQNSLVIVTADHGGHGLTHGSDDPQDMTIPWLAFGAVQPGPISQRIVTYDTAATAVAALGYPIPSSWQGNPILEPVGVTRDK